MLRLTAGPDGKGSWRQWQPPGQDAMSDYGADLPNADPSRNISMAGTDGRVESFVAPPGSPMLRFDTSSGRWQVLPTPFSTLNRSTLYPHGGVVRRVEALAPDNDGGFWLVDDFGAFYHYTDRVPQPVFEDTPHPIPNQGLAAGSRYGGISAFAGAADGTLWVGTDTAGLFRYDRLTGWVRVPTIPGWDGPRRSIQPTGVTALALGPDGEGIAIGPGGRIANIGRDGASLDPAAGKTCDLRAVAPPCGTGYDLTAAAVAPDGSALAAGGNRLLLWRPAGGEFRRLPRAQAPPTTAAIEAAAMPRPDRAWLLTRGRIYAGELSGGAWQWRIDNLDAEGRFIAQLASGKPREDINAIAIDAQGHGYAVGGGGFVLERTGDSEQPWRQLDIGFGANLTSVALPAGGGEGALIGGEWGLVLTLAGGRFEVARPIDFTDPVIKSDNDPAEVVGMAVLPGIEAGQVEAWVALKGGLRNIYFGPRQQPTALLHYASDAMEPLLDPQGRASALPDAPAPRPGELSFAAFGKSDCYIKIVDSQCSELTFANMTNELIAKRVTEEILERGRRPGGPAFAVFTGDVNDVSGKGYHQEGVSLVTEPVGPRNTPATPIDPSVVHRRWVELVADRLTYGGVPVFGAIGGQDLSDTQYCDSSGFLFKCLSTGKQSALQQGGGSNQQASQKLATAGLNLPWRWAMRGRPAPWGSQPEEEDLESGALSFVPVKEPLTSVPLDDDLTLEGAELQDPAGNTTTVPRTTVPAGARTHYALDVVDASDDGERLARLVFVDTSLGSLAAADRVQNPQEAGGQAAWLEEVLCFEGSADDTGGDLRDCTREEGQAAIVVSNTPTYSYAPHSPGETQADGAAFEALLMKHRASLVVSGRLGWNGLYWAIAPGVHEPCPGGEYQAEPPEPGVRVCGHGADAGELEPPEAPGLDQSADGAVPAALPFVVASSAGGKFNDVATRSGQATAEQGFWHGYTIVRLDASGDPRKTIVEQRPILDWVQLTAPEHTLQPGERVTLRGIGREAFGTDTTILYHRIDSPAITHRYDLLLADPEEPWLPCEAADSGCQALYSKLASGSRSFDSAGGEAAGSAQDDKCSPYLCLPERVGTIDAQSGEVQAGAGKHPDTFAVAMLSVGEHAATWPLVFKKSPSFVVNPAVGFPAIPGVPTGTATAPQPPAPPNPPQPNVPQASVPDVPPPPPVPPIAASEPPEPQPPAPPAPPPPTEQPSPLNLTIAPPGITVATPTAVIQPPTPPVNPAPPGGARREARQRQAAAQKSGADGDEARKEGVDLADGPPAARGSNEMTRYRPIEHHSASSPAAQAALYTGALALIAASLAAGWRTRRPGPDIRPAPETARYRSR